MFARANTTIGGLPVKKYLTLAMAVIFSGSALAADLSAPAIAEPASPVKTKHNLWTGAYVEGAVGLASENVEASGFGSSIDLGDTAFSGHFGIGFDKLLAERWLVGGFARIQRDAVSIDAFGAEAEVDYSWSLGARFGIVPRNDVLLYGLVGYQWDEIDFKMDGDGASEKRDGWVLGGGIEAALTNHLFIGAEVSTTLYEDESMEDIKIESDNWRSVVSLKYKF